MLRVRPCNGPPAPGRQSARIPVAPPLLLLLLLPLRAPLSSSVATVPWSKTMVALTSY